MRAKELKAVVTFASTSDAMAMEAAAREHGLPGRVIPVPSEIDAGCGLAWCISIEEKETLLTGMQALGLAYEAMAEIMMY